MLAQWWLKKQIWKQEKRSQSYVQRLLKVSKLAIYNSLDAFHLLPLHLPLIPVRFTLCVTKCQSKRCLFSHTHVQVSVRAGNTTRNRRKSPGKKRGEQVKKKKPSRRWTTLQPHCRTPHLAPPPCRLCLQPITEPLLPLIYGCVGVFNNWTHGCKNHWVGERLDFCDIWVETTSLLQLIQSVSAVRAERD